MGKCRSCPDLSCGLAYLLHAFEHFAAQFAVFVFGQIRNGVRVDFWR
jgi:hypothetical protein